MNSDEKEIERANSYRQMFEQWAWKDLSRIIDEVRNQAFQDAIYASEISKVQECRGIVKGIDSILGEINYIVGERK